MFPELERSLSASRWGRGSSTKTNGFVSGYCFDGKKKNKEAPDLPVDGASHYNMSGGAKLYMGIMLLWEYSVRGQYSTVWLAKDFSVRLSTLLH